jgi:phospholipid/cholesterol/gamma-HCH transport system substrate-binding protein
MERDSVSSSGIRGLSLKVALLTALIPLVVIGLILYALSSRGLFEPNLRIYALTRNAEGASVGMAVTYAGYPIGNVTRMQLTDTGEVRLDLRLRKKDARFLRESSVFTLSKPLIGAARIDAATPDMDGQPLAEGAQVSLLSNDATAAIPDLVASVQEVLQSVNELTGKDSSLQRSLANFQSITEKMNSEYGLLEAVTGSADNARGILNTMTKVNALVDSLNATSMRTERLLAKADAKVFDQGGVLEEAGQSMQQLTALLSETRQRLQIVDNVLANAQAATANVKDATEDLGSLRTQIEANIEKVQAMVDEINRRWPFAGDRRITLP